MYVFDVTNKYRPTPTEIPPAEGEAMMQVAAESLSYINTLGSDTLITGYNNSPWNYGEEEEQGGMQSLTTKWHMHVLGINRASEPKADLFDPIIPENARKFMLGEPLNRLAGKLIEEFIREMDPEIINKNSLNIDNRGVHVALDRDLINALHTPGFFSHFLQPLHNRIQQAMIDVGGALTDVD